MKQIILATKNKNKLVEVKAVLGNDYEVLSMEDIGIDVDVEENGTTFEENATYAFISKNESRRYLRYGSCKGGIEYAKYVANLLWLMIQV